MYYCFINPGVSWVSLLKIPFGRWWSFCFCSCGPFLRLPGLVVACSFVRYCVFSYAVFFLFIKINFCYVLGFSPVLFAFVFVKLETNYWLCHFFYYNKMHMLLLSYNTVDWFLCLLVPLSFKGIWIYFGLLFLAVLFVCFIFLTLFC